MRKWFLRLLYVSLALAPIAAVADYTATTGAGSTVFAFVCSTTKICPAMVLIDSTNVEKGTTANPVSITGTGTAGTAATNPVTVQGIPGMTKLLVTPDSVALPANQSVNEAQINGVTPLMGNGVTGTGSQRVTIASDNTAIAGVGAAAQGSTTSGQSGVLSQCAVTTGAPTYTTAQTDPLSCTIAGGLRTDTSTVNGVTALTGTGATGAGSQRVTVATDQATNAGAALVKGGVGVVNGGSTYQAVAASQTATVLQSSTGAAGDYLSHCVIYPTSTSPGVVTVFDNTNTAATSAILFAGGASSLSNLAPIPVPVGAVSSAGAWKVTTGANVSVVCYGKFS